MMYLTGPRRACQGDAAGAGREPGGRCHRLAQFRRFPLEPPRPQPPPAVETPSALGPNHPWAVRPEHGNYLIHVKSYSRPHRPDPNDPGKSAKELAEALADEIRKTHGVNVYLFEYISEEKKA